MEHEKILFLAMNRLVSRSFQRNDESMEGFCVIQYAYGLIDDFSVDEMWNWSQHE